MTREEEYYKPCSKCDNDQCIFKGTDDIHNICEDYKPKDDKWIPASKPPKEDGKYLVTDRFLGFDHVRILGYAKDMYEKDNIDYCDYKGKSCYYSIYDGRVYKKDGVIAWMPLPEPYKKGDEESDAE